MTNTVSRRRFLALTAGAAALGRAPAFAQGTTLRLLQWSHFVPAADKVFELQAAEFDLEVSNGSRSNRPRCGKHNRN